MDTKWQREIIGEKEITLTFIFNFCFIVLASSEKHLLRYSDNKELHPIYFECSDTRRQPFHSNKSLINQMNKNIQHESRIEWISQN